MQSQHRRRSHCLPNKVQHRALRESLSAESQVVHVVAIASTFQSLSCWHEFALHVLGLAVRSKLVFFREEFCHNDVGSRAKAGALGPLVRLPYGTTCHNCLIGYP